MAEFEYLNAGNSEAQDKLATAYLLAQTSTGLARTGVLAGLAVSQTTTASGSVLIDAGAGVNQASVLVGTSILVADTQKTLDVFTAHPVGGLPRNDIVVFDATIPGLTVIVGDPNATPNDPTIPATVTRLARLRHAASATTIPTAKIDDLRVFTAPYAAIIPVRNVAERDAITWGTVERNAFVSIAGALYVNAGAGWTLIGASSVVSGAGTLSATTTETAFTGCSISLPAGTWDIDASAYADWATAGGTPPRWVFHIRQGSTAGAELDRKEIYIGSQSGSLPVALMKSGLVLASTTTVLLTADVAGPASGVTLGKAGSIRATRRI